MKCPLLRVSVHEIRLLQVNHSPCTAYAACRTVQLRQATRSVAGVLLSISPLLVGVIIVYTSLGTWLTASVFGRKYALPISVCSTAALRGVRATSCATTAASQQPAHPPVTLQAPEPQVHRDAAGS